MKTAWIRFILSCALMSEALSAAADQYAVLLSPWQSAEAAKTEVKHLLQFATELAPGDTLVAMDGYHLTRLGMFTVPEGKAYQHAKARLAVNREVVGNLLRFARQAHAPKGSNDPRVKQALRLPQALRALAAGRTGTDSLEVLVLGSARYDEPSAFTMANGHVPGDGHLALPLSQTPYGTADTPTLLQGVRVYQVYPEVLATGRQSEFLKRFWTLWTEAQGGKVVSFTNDWQSALQAIQSKAPAPSHAYQVQPTDKLEMIEVLPTRFKQAGLLFEREVTTTPLATTTRHHADKVVVGITWWDCVSCDIDLYARATPTADTLYYGHRDSADGHFAKDYQRSPELSQGLETVTFSRPLDLTELRLAVNFYSGQAPGGIHGEIRLAVADQAYALRFHIPATSGNGGQDIQAVLSGKVSRSAHSVLIDPLTIFGKEA